MLDAEYFEKIHKYGTVPRDNAEVSESVLYIERKKTKTEGKAEVGSKNPNMGRKSLIHKYH